MEILAEIALSLVRFLGEILLQMIFEALAELGLRSLREPFRRPKPLHPVLAALGYLALGGGAGALSLLAFPEVFIDSVTGRLVNLVVTPLAAGLLMGALGAWRRRRNQETIRLDRFGYGFVFALSMALVHFIWAGP